MVDYWRHCSCLTKFYSQYHSPMYPNKKYLPTRRPLKFSKKEASIYSTLHEHFHVYYSHLNLPIILGGSKESPSLCGCGNWGSGKLSDLFRAAQLLIQHPVSVYSESKVTQTTTKLTFQISETCINSHTTIHITSAAMAMIKCLFL